MNIGLPGLATLNNAAERPVRIDSVGMRKRPEPVEDLIRQPKLLLPDSLTIPLGRQTRAVIWDHKRKLQKEHNTTPITYYVEEAKYLCDRMRILAW